MREYAVKLSKPKEQENTLVETEVACALSRDTAYQSDGKSDVTQCRLISDSLCVCRSVKSGRASKGTIEQVHESSYAG